MGKNNVVAVLVIDAMGLETLEYLLSKYGGKIKVPNLAAMGLGEIIKPGFASRIGKKTDPGAYAARIEQASASADSVIGHREMVGIIDDRTFNLFQGGFPPAYIKELEQRIGQKTIFNKMAGGIEAIELNADEHSKTGCPIVYASKCDPLIQIAMDEAVIPVKKQHAIADTAFKLAMEMGIPVTRAIARAYVRKEDGEIVRTPNRHDAVLPMETKTLVDMLYERNVWTVAVGKTSELVNTNYHDKIKLTNRAFVDPALDFAFVHPKGKDTNPFSAQGVLNAMSAAKHSYRPNGTFIFANFVDTDSLYGHTRDVEGSLHSLEAADALLGVVLKTFRSGDMLIITADHGMAHRSDYGYHNKEDLALLVKRFGAKKPLGGLAEPSKKTLADVGWLTAQFFGCEKEFVSASGTGRFFGEGK